MPNMMPEYGCQPNRRAALQAFLLGSISGCSSSSSLSQLFSFHQPDRLHLFTPWNLSLQTRWSEDFNIWLKSQNLAPIHLQWLEVPENELAKSHLDHLSRFANGLVGGHKTIHRRFESKSLINFNLNQVRAPAVTSKIRSSPIALPEQTLNTRKNWSNIGNPNDWPAMGQSLFLSDPDTDLLTHAYLFAVFQSAPDQASGFARWIRLARQVSTTAHGNGSTNVSQLVLTHLDFEDYQIWRGGPALAKTLGIEETGPIYWPECISTWNSLESEVSSIDKFQLFCKMTNRLKTVSHPDGAQIHNHDFTSDMGSIILKSCLTELRSAWQTIETTTGELRIKAEKYITELPPWPPASIQDLQKRRGFEYVVALVEQMAADAGERDWLIQEFQSPQDLLNLQKLDQAQNGRLQNSIRFRAWLKAEWRAWIQQRCRRVTRYLKEI